MGAGAAGGMYIPVATWEWGGGQGQKPSQYTLSESLS